VDQALQEGRSIRNVASSFRVSRSTLARHRLHSQVSAPVEGDDRSLDPLAEALAIATRATTDRQLLRAAEAIRAATALQLRSLRRGDMDAQTLFRLDSNVAEAEVLYRRVGGFENELRGLAGHREAIRQRVDALKATKPPEDRPNIIVTFHAIDAPLDCDGPGPGVDERTRRFHSVPDEFAEPPFHEIIELSFSGTAPSVSVCDGTGQIVWERVPTEGNGRGRS
jgi:hypothetical protein